jgi:UV excision repair protein RAD23
MKITIKTLKQISYTVEVPESSIVQELKQAIENQYGLDAKSIKLLYNGKVLEESNNLSEFGIKEGHVLMMMNAKAKPQNVQQQIKEEKKVEEPLPTNSENKIVEKKKKSVQAAQPNKDYSSEINQLKEMGFTDEMSKLAIEASQGNVSQAIEYLYNGIPNTKVTDQQLYEDFFDEDGEEEEPFELDPEMLNNLDLNNPETLKKIASIVKVLIQEDQSQLSNLLLDIEDTNPDVIEFIRENENEFKALIEKPLTNEDIQLFESIMPAGHAQVEDVLDEGMENLMQHVTNIIGQQQGQDHNLNQADKDAIERLKALGFNEAEVYQAYMACDKNETLAANFLFDNKLKDDMNVDCKLILLI